LRDLVDANISLSQASGEGQGSGGKQGSQSFHRFIPWQCVEVVDLCKWVQINQRNLTHP
jgi:hypothetical protein